MAITESDLGASVRPYVARVRKRDVLFSVGGIGADAVPRRSSSTPR
jgi:hypothetical protein